MKHTKEQLEGMSDLEVNKLVAKVIYGDINTFTSPSERNGEVWIEKASGGLINTNYDPCNNPSDMMPLVFDSTIELSPLFCGEWCASELNNYTYEEEPIYNGYQVAHKNPLRAAAIVWLLMQGDNHE